MTASDIPSSPGKGNTVLIVEDDADIRETLVDLFRDAGFSTLEAENGSEALTALSSTHMPDIVLLDMLMPVMDGATFLKTVAGMPKYRDLPVVVVSANPSVRPPGAAAVVRKPFDTQELLAVIHAHIRPRAP